MTEKRPLISPEEQLKEHIIAEFGLDLNIEEDQITLGKILQAATMSNVSAIPGGAAVKTLPSITDKTRYSPRSAPRRSGY